jgi:hypothetical protein
MSRPYPLKLAQRRTLDTAVPATSMPQGMTSKQEIMLDLVQLMHSRPTIPNGTLQKRTRIHLSSSPSPPGYIFGPNLTTTWI